MALDLKSLKPSTVSRDLRGKFVFLYGAPKIGKTTLASQFPKALILGFEHGINALDDVYFVDVPTWAEFKKYLRQLSEEDVKSQFNTIVIDTIGLAYERCESYICDREGVDKIGDIPYGAGYKMVSSEFETCMRKITQIMGEDGRTAYGLCFIGHEKVRVETDGQISVKHITPDVPDRCASIINRMVDITAYIGMEKGIRYIYPRQLVIEDGSQKTEIYAGSHFSGLNSKISLSYEALVDAIADAMTGNIKKITDAPVQVQATPELDFKAIRTSIGTIAKAFKKLDDTDENLHYMEAYKNIVESYLGKGKLVKDCTEAQVDHLSLILEDLQTFVDEHKITI